jgi:hypothetical protein
MYRILLNITLAHYIIYLFAIGNPPNVNHYFFVINNTDIRVL